MSEKSMDKLKYPKLLAIFKEIWCSAGVTLVFVSFFSLCLTKKLKELTDAYHGIDFPAVVAQSGPWYMKAAYFFSDNINLAWLDGIWWAVMIACLIYECFLDRKRKTVNQ